MCSYSLLSAAIVRPDVVITLKAARERTPTGSHPAVGPVELLEDRLKVLHGSIGDQHDGLVAHAALPVHPGLRTHTKKTSSAQR